MTINDGDTLEELASRAAEGDREAFRTLVDRTQAGAYRLALRIVGNSAEAEDVVQDSYLRAWNGLGRLRDGRAVRGWIYAIVRNVASTQARARAQRDARHVELEVDGMDELARTLAAHEPLPDEVAVASQLRSTVRKLVGQLKEKYRVPLLLRMVDGMSYGELSDALGIPIGTVESRLFRARQQLGKKLEQGLRVPDRESA